MQLEDLHDKGFLRGTLSVDEQHSLIAGSTDIGEAVTGAFFVQVLFSLKIGLGKVMGIWFKFHLLKNWVGRGKGHKLFMQVIHCRLFDANQSEVHLLVLFRAIIGAMDLLPRRSVDAVMTLADGN